MARRLARLSAFGKPADQKRGQRRDQQRHQQQPPANPGRADQAGEHLQRLADRPAKQRLHAAADAVHIVGEAAHQFAAAVLAEAGQIHPQRAAIELLAQFERGHERQPIDPNRIEHHADVFEQRRDHQHADDQDQRLERIVGQIAIDVGLEPLPAVERFLLDVAVGSEAVQRELQFPRRWLSGRRPIRCCAVDLSVEIGDAMSRFGDRLDSTHFCSDWPPKITWITGYMPPIFAPHSRATSKALSKVPASVQRYAEPDRSARPKLCINGPSVAGPSKQPWK